MAIGYFEVSFISLLILAVASAWPDGPLNWIYFLLSSVAGIHMVVGGYRVAATLATPLTLFAWIWLLLIPATAFAAPLMEAMTRIEIQQCATFGVFYSLGGVLALMLGPRQIDQVPVGVNGDPPSSMRKFATILIVASIAALAVNVAHDGGIALLRESAEERKAAATFFAYPLLASLGTISMALFASARRVGRGPILLVVCYVGLQLMSGQRFVAILGLALALLMRLASSSLGRQQLRTVAVGLLAIVSAFLVVAHFRGGADDHFRYHIETGIYQGDPAILDMTEIVRYVGMSQRNMTTVTAVPFSFDHLLEYTLSPIRALTFRETPGGLGTSLYGYTANNAIAYLHHDAGFMWPALAAILSFIVNSVFWIWRRKSASITWRFAWSVSAAGILMSFFAFLNAYLYWVIAFPAIVALADALSSGSRKCGSDRGGYGMVTATISR